MNPNPVEIALNQEGIKTSSQMSATWDFYRKSHKWIEFIARGKSGKIVNKQLYEQDFNLWAEQMAIAIREGNLIDMDWENLSEEVEDMSKSEKRSLESYLERLIEHILKLQYWESEYQQNYRHWRAEVTNFRNRIKRIVHRSPSLNNYMSDVYPGIFQDAVDAKINEFQIPDACFIPLEEILKKDYFG